MVWQLGESNLGNRLGLWDEGRIRSNGILLDETLLGRFVVTGRKLEQIEQMEQMERLTQGFKKMREDGEHGKGSKAMEKDLFCVLRVICALFVISINTINI